MAAVQEMSEKQKKSLKESTARINLWVGAVRSGKSYASLWRFLKYIINGPPGDLMIIGKSADTIKRNIVSELMDFLGVDVRYYEGKRELHLWGRKIYLVGANDERAVQKIQGSTLAGAYVDELCLIPQSFWTMLLSRLSVTGAQLFCTTNPDSPFHWVKTDILDRKDELDLKTWEFYLEDNPSLDETYKENLKREYRGLWYQRFIEGKWVLAEGTIYDFFDNNLHCIDFSPRHNAHYYLCGIDYGTVNPAAFVLVGYNPDEHPNMWAEKEYYWDSEKEKRQKTDTEYALDFVKFTKDLAAPLNGVYIDPSASSFQLELRRQGVRNVVHADNDVLNGIRFVSNLLANGTLKICKRCKNLIDEMGTYVWDSKAKNLGEDKPLKKNDHCEDALRYILFTCFGQNMGSENRLTKERLRALRIKHVDHYR